MTVRTRMTRTVHLFLSPILLQEEGRTHCYHLSVLTHCCCFTMFTCSAACSHVTILDANIGSTVSITLHPLVFALRRVMSAVPLYIQSSMILPNRSAFTNIWYLSILHLLSVRFTQRIFHGAFLPNDKWHARHVHEAALATGLEALNENLDVGIILHLLCRTALWT